MKQQDMDYSGPAGLNLKKPTFLHCGFWIQPGMVSHLKIENVELFLVDLAKSRHQPHLSRRR